ncbi:MAG: DUF6179 domain-containing protein [Coriobacteriales bacterium]
MNSRNTPSQQITQTQAPSAEVLERRAQALAGLVGHLMQLYTCGDASTVSQAEGYALLESACYVLGVNALEDESAALLESEDLPAVFHEKRRALEQQAENLLQLWQDVCLTMPQINNIALRDTLASIGGFKARYDTLFAAHEVPAEIDYPLSRPVPEQLKGLDYLHAWLTQLQREARYLARFDLGECIRVLESSCPDYQGLHVNLCDLIERAEQRGLIAPLSRP